MLENLFEIGFVLALVLPPLAVLAGVIFLAAPQFPRPADVTHASVHP